MCVGVKVNGEVCTTVKQLRKHAPVIILDDNYGDMIGDFCLCPVDIAKTASENGFVVVENSPMEFEFKKIVEVEE